MPHWRSMMDREYFGAWDFVDSEMRGRDRTLEIAHVHSVKLEGTAIIKASRKPVLEFVGTEKRLIVNATIGKTIAGMYGNDVRAWGGRLITLHGATTKSKGGETVDCVRVRPAIPKGATTNVEPRPVDEAMRERQRRGAGELPVEPTAQPSADVCNAPPVALSREPGVD